MARKGWNALSPGYRARIEKAGLTRADYEAGQSLQKARGHAETPEHPKQFSPAKFPKYAAERQRLTTAVERKKQQIFDGGPKWNPARSARHIREKPPSLAMLRWALQASEQDIRDAIRHDPETFHFLGYH